MSQSLNKSILFHHRCRKKQEHSQSSKDFSMAISIPLFVVNIKIFLAQHLPHINHSKSQIMTTNKTPINNFKHI